MSAAKKKKKKGSFSKKHVLFLCACIIAAGIFSFAAGVLFGDSLLSEFFSKAEQPPEEPVKEPPSQTDLPSAPELSGQVPPEPQAEQEDAQESPPIPQSPQIPPAQNAAKIAFIIDDAGESVENVRRYADLPMPLTIAVLPRVKQSRECADVARSAGKEVILHQPMQAENPAMNPGAGAVLQDMHTNDIAQVLKENIERIGPVSGMNNHEGSLITSDIIRIGAVLEFCAGQNLYFIDSRTALAEKNKVRQAALELDIAIIERNAPFLDNIVTREELLAEIVKGLEVANRHGHAVMIGHVDKSVEIFPALLAELYPQLIEKGYAITTPSQLLAARSAR